MTLDERSAFDIWWNFVCPFTDWVHRYCQSANDEVIRELLHNLDWELYFISLWVGRLENCGNFTDTAGSFPQHEQVLREAFLRFGCPNAAAVLQDCIELSLDFDKSPEWSDEFESRRNLIESKADWSYLTIVQYLVTHAQDYSFSILPFCCIKQDS